MRTLARWLGAVTVIVLLLLAVRVALFYRMATMARLWCRLGAGVPAPSPFALTSFAASMHGVGGDIVFLRITYPVAGEETVRQAILTSPGLNDPDTATLTVPLPAPDSLPCSDNGDPFRIHPDRLPALNWSTCYRIADRFDLANVRQGEAWHIPGRRGGLVVLDTRRHLLFIAAYRTK